MATLDRIVIRNFRNIALQELGFSPNVNCITGGNGEGKTNLLDAIHYLSMTKSAFSTSDGFNFRHGTSEFALGGSYTLPGGLPTRISIRVAEGQEKRLIRDDKAVGRLSAHIGLLPVVMVSPSDVAMVSDSGDTRRKFLNAVLSQMDSTYLYSIQQYNKLLAQRNSLLKNPVQDDCLMDVIESSMEELAVPVSEARRNLTLRLSPTVSQYYARIAGTSEEAGISYHTDADKGPLAEILKSTRERDRILKYTGSGLQRDDLIFTLDGHPIRRCGSQGQQKSFLVALKFAQYEVMRGSDRSGTPILLLDDLFDKLDMNRVQNLLEMVSTDSFGQIFITDSNKVRIRGIVDAVTSDRAYYEAAGGEFRTADEQA